MTNRRHIKTFMIILVMGLSFIIQIQSGSTTIITNSEETVLNQTELVIPLITDSIVVIDGVISVSEYGATFLESDSGIAVYWEHNGVDLTVGLVSPGTGWVSLGIGDKMKDSNMILGGVNGSASYCYDVVGLSGHNHANDTENGGEYSVLDYSVSETGSSTTLEIIIPLDADDLLDPVLEMGSIANFFFAYSQNNDSMIIQDHFLAPRSDIISALIEDEQLDLDDFDRSIPLNLESGVIINGQISDGEYSTTFFDGLTGIQVNWEHDNSIFSIGLVSPGTGWVALGIGPDMQRSTMYMGGVENGGTYCADLDGLENWLHEEDATNDIIDCIASETDEKTTLEFTIPMNTTDSLDTNLEVQSVYQMFLAYHSSSDDRIQIHTSHSEVFTVLVMPEAQSIQTFITLSSETEVDFNETVYFEIELMDENGSLANVPVVFYKDSQFGEIIIATTHTDESGKANASYYNPYLSREHTFGARSLEMVIVESGEVYSYESSDIKQKVVFIQEHKDGQRAENIRLTRVGLLVAFWLVGIVIWGGFVYSFFQMIQIFRGRNEELEGNVNSQSNVSLKGGMHNE